MSSASRSLERVCAAARWTETDARVVIDEFRASGLSAQEFGTRCTDPVYEAAAEPATLTA